MTDKILKGVYYQPDHLWTCRKAIRELHKIKYTPKRGVRLAKQAFWQVHISHPKKINYSHYDVTKLYEQHQFGLLYVPNNIFKGNINKYILTGVDAVSRYKVATALKTKKASEFGFVLELICKIIVDVLKYPEVFQFDNGLKLKSDVTRLPEKHDADIRRTTTKYKPTHTAFVEAFFKELAKQLFKPMGGKEFLGP